MARKLFTVEDTFTIRGRGTVLVPGLVPESDERFRIGDSLRLVHPDGSELVVAISGIEFFNPGPQAQYPVLVALPKSEVPIGSEVWSL
jgi:hypothetical protein